MDDTLLATLQELKGRLDALVVRQASYSTHEFAKLVGLSDWTVRNYCRLGRLRARKKRSGRGAHPEWVLDHEELERFRREGLFDG
ncbi:MAG TPA: helix-turn-helix domain-containing protein [Thermoanaerobaculia bacterium]